MKFSTSPPEADLRRFSATDRQDSFLARCEKRRYAKPAALATLAAKKQRRAVMDAATVHRIISLIPDRAAWTPSGSVYSSEGKSERVALIARLTHWLSPLDALSVENQQFLGLRANGARPADAEAEETDMADDMDEPSAPLHAPGAGTQIAA